MMTPVEPAIDILYGDPQLAQFYDLDNLWGADLEYILYLADGARSVLDLGCGTGQLAARLAYRRTVVGVDAAPAMLDIARSRLGGDEVTWVEADAREVRLGAEFDLVVLTGHAFQVFLTPKDQQAVISTIAAHLLPGGRFIFDTRNPAAQAWAGWTRKASMRRFEHSGLGTVEAWNDFDRDADTGVVTYQTHYHVLASERHFSAASRIQFTSRESVAAMCDHAGLEVEEWLGDWLGGACDQASREIIVVGRLR